MTTSENLRLRPGALTRSLPRGTVGTAQIVHDAPDMLTRLRAARDGQPLNAPKYTRLLIDGSVWMTDAEFECATNKDVVRESKGSVLLFGLGLGLILPSILMKASVNHVAVVEINKDVISLVGPNYEDPKLMIRKGDAFRWKPSVGKKFDVIYFDVFQNVPNEDDADAIRRLKSRYRPYLRRGGWMTAWCEWNV